MQTATISHSDFLKSPFFYGVARALRFLSNRGMDRNELFNPESAIKAVRSGDVDAVGALVEHYRPYLRLLARVSVGRRLQSKLDESDIVQEASLMVARDLQEFRGETEKELTAWLRRVLTNVIANTNRHYSRDRRNVQYEQELQSELDQSSAGLSRLVGNESTPSRQAMRREHAVILRVRSNSCGTLRYMSPEQIDGAQAVDQRSDVYSLGVSLYELVAGKTAFASSTKANLIADILHGQVPRLSSLIRDIPRDLETVIHKAMSLHADARYQSASEMAGDLNSFLQGKPVTARRASSLEVIGRWCLRNRSKAALLGLVAAIVLTLAVGGPFIAWRQTTIATRQRHEAYDANMALANDHIEHGEIDQAVVLLKEYLPDVDGSTNDYRSFEWYEMIERCQRRLEATAVPHEWPIRALAASRNGDIAIAPFFQGPVVLSSTNGERLWPAPDNPQLSSSVQALAYTPDGRFLLAGGANKKLNLWSTDSQTVVHSEQLAARMSSVATNDQGLIAVGLWPNVSDPFPQTTPAPIVTYQIVEADGHVSLRESSTLVGTMGAAEKIAFAPDGTRLAGASHDGVLRIFLPDKAVYSVVFAEQRGTSHSRRRPSYLCVEYCRRLSERVDQRACRYDTRSRRAAPTWSAAASLRR